MNKQEKIFSYAIPILLIMPLLALILILIGPTLGSLPGEIHTGLHEMLVKDDMGMPDNAPPLAQSWPARPADLDYTSVLTIATPPTFTLISTIASSPTVTLTDTMTPSTPCAALHFAGSARFDGGLLTFGQLNLVNSTFPHAKTDPLTAPWKTILFESIPIVPEFVEQEEGTALSINRDLNFSLIDFATQEPLLSGRWTLEVIDLTGSQGSVNTALAVNVNDIRVNNAIDSDTLYRFSQTTQAVLVMQFKHNEAIATALQDGTPIYLFIMGTMYTASCQH